MEDLLRTRRWRGLDIVAYSQQTAVYLTKRQLIVSYIPVYGFILRSVRWHISEYGGN